MAILLELELKLKADILDRMKKKGLAPISMTEADVDLNTHYTSDIESRYHISESAHCACLCLFVFVYLLFI